MSHRAWRGLPGCPPSPARVARMTTIPPSPAARTGGSVRLSEWSTRTRNTTAGGSIAATVEKCFAARFRVVGRTWTLSDMLGRQSSGSASPGKEYGRGWVDGSSPGAAAGSRKEARSIGTARACRLASTSRCRKSAPCDLVLPLDDLDLSDYKSKMGRFCRGGQGAPAARITALRHRAHRLRLPAPSPLALR